VRNINSTDCESCNNSINGDFNAVGESRGGEKAVKDEMKSSRGSLKSGDKGEQVMDWEADTKDVLEQLLRDDVTIHINFSFKTSEFNIHAGTDDVFDNDVVFSALVSEGTVYWHLYKCQSQFIIYLFGVNGLFMYHSITDAEGKVYNLNCNDNVENALAYVACIIAQ